MYLLLRFPYVGSVLAACQGNRPRIALLGKLLTWWSLEDDMMLCIATLAPGSKV